MPSFSSRRPLPVEGGGGGGGGGDDAALVRKQERDAYAPAHVPPLGDMDDEEGNRMNFRDYLQVSGIPALFDTLTAVLLREKPENPVAFILSWLRNERAQVVARNTESARGSDDSYDDCTSGGSDSREDDSMSDACSFSGTQSML